MGQGAGEEGQLSTLLGPCSPRGERGRGTGPAAGADQTPHTLPPTDPSGKCARVAVQEWRDSTPACLLSGSVCRQPPAASVPGRPRVCESASAGPSDDTSAAELPAGDDGQTGGPVGDGDAAHGGMNFLSRFAHCLALCVPSRVMPGTQPILAGRKCLVNERRRDREQERGSALQTPRFPLSILPVS